MNKLLLAACWMALAAQEPPRTGPATEKRFPPLKVPPGFKATLFACDPLIEYPSVLAPGPRPGSIFLAHDYMTGLGTEIVRRDDIRLVEDTDGDGYADASTVYATGFNSIQGLAFHDGRVFAMHAPFLTALRDADGDGVADERRDLLAGLGWTPEKAPDRLHGANGVVAGRDGWLYLAQGDRGADVLRPEGDRLVLHGGGILRCRPDGSDLHVFSTGLRNIYDIALDDELNVFVRDNENDGGTYMIRVARSFFGADHGYPYLYGDRPDEALAPLADLGRGSSAGGVCYLGTAFPAEYRGNLFFCEWGRSIVRYRRERAGAGFAAMKEIEFASGAPEDPYGFKPTDIVVDRDGSLLVSDWCDDQRPKRGRGRVYRIRYEGGVSREPEKPDPLGDVWKAKGLETLFGLAESDPDPGVRVQAVRAIADLADPALAKHRLDAGRGDPEIARRLAALGRGQDPRVLLEVTIALGRLRWVEAPSWLAANLGTPDATLAHAAQQTLRRAENWPAVLEWLDGPLRPIAIRALADRPAVDAVDGLLRRLESEREPARRREIADLLARVHRKPGPWVYWGFRPGPRPANTEAWERTGAIEAALDRTLADPDRGVRLAALRRMEREKITVRPGTLVRWLREERDPERVGAILASLKSAPDKAGPAAEEVVRDRAYAVDNRRAALELVADARLLEVAGSIEESPVLADALRRLGGRPALDSRALLAAKLGATSPDVRLAAVDALADLGAREAAGALVKLLEDREAPVRAGAAAAAGRLGIGEAAERLLSLAGDADALVRRRSLESLARLREPRALAPALRALEDAEPPLAAIECVAEVGGPEQADAVAAFASRSRSLDVLQTSVRALAKWRQPKAVARVQGASGVLLQWSVGGSRPVESMGLPTQAIPDGWETSLGAGSDSRATLGAGTALSDFFLAEPMRAQFLASSNGTLEVWLNGRAAYRRPQAGAYAPDSDRFEADLPEGANRIVVQVAAAGKAQLQVRFRRKSSVERHEKLAQLALTTKGNAERGREVFLNAEKSACIKCHRLGDQGGRIGPDLTGVGRRFSRIHLVESILEPSRVIAPAFRNFAVRLKNGDVLAGVKVAETETAVTLGDAQGQTHVVPLARIDEQRLLELSVMPEGLEKGLTDREFADLIGFLAEQK